MSRPSSSHSVDSNISLQMLPPSQLRGTIVLENSYDGSATRFASESHRPMSARTATMLTVSQHHQFAPIDSNNISFQNLTGSPVSISKVRCKRQVFRSNTQDVTEPPPKLQKRQKSGSHTSSQPKLILRTSRPIQNAKKIHLDAWKLLLSVSNLKFLLEARTICKAFNQLLWRHQAIWRASREKEFGRDMPLPPGQMTERAYADLLVGRGCQNRTCTKKDTNKVYWVFRVRLCSDCFKLKTVRRDELQGRVRNVNGVCLVDLLPGAITRSGKYQGSRTFDPATQQWDSTANSVLYLRRDFDHLEREYLQIMQDEQKKETLPIWVSEKLAETVALMGQVREFEKWQINLANYTSRPQSQRAQYFQSRAALLSPPITKEVLQVFIAYNKAVEGTIDATERVWNGLKEKVIPLQADAEKLVILERQMHLYGGRSTSTAEIDVFKRLHFHRCALRHKTSTLQPEQQLVINLGKEALRACKARGVPDADLLLVCLQDVFRHYSALHDESRPTGMNADGTLGPYRLTLDDARMIVEDVLESEVEKHSQRGVVILQQFRCMGCTRKDSTKRYTFQKGLEHIFEKHARLVGEGHLYYKLFQPHPRLVGDTFFRFPWYTVEWPKCLPLVPGYRELTHEDKWDPEGDAKYGATSKSNSKSAFERRQPYDNPDVGQRDFTGNLVFAADSLKKTSLDAVCQTRIMLQYAIDRYARTSAESPSLAVFSNSIREIQFVNPTIDFRFRCRVCFDDCRRKDNLHRNSKYVKSLVLWHELVEHWNAACGHRLSWTGNGQKRQESGLCWTTNMMHLPDDVEVWDAMVVADEKLKGQKEKVRRREEKRGNVARMKADAKAGVVLGMEEAVGVFDRLFPVIS